ncbi:MAG: UPF0182 family protein [Gemmatimonadales bacterium]
MTRAGRRRLYLIGAVLLVAALVGGRWLAVETAERAWDQTFAGGTAIIEARDLARLLQALVLVVSITWITGNLLVVYRAIGSVQMPRRLGDLEIVEAVPQRALLGATVLLGVVLGSLFALGTGNWWRHAVLAASPPHFGIPDATKLGRDVGYYVSTLPWLAVLQNRALILAVGALGIITVLYAVIGSLRFRRGRVRASDYARAHAGVLLACLALVIAWGALLDPAEVIAGLHGPVDQASLAVRVPGSAVVVAVAVVTAVISIAWAWRDRPTLILAGWAALVISLTAGYFVIPGVVRASSGVPSGTGGESSELARRRTELERVAFGVTALDDGAPSAFPSGEAALRTMPLWDAIHVGRAVGDANVSVALRPPRPDDNGAAWLVASPTGPVRLALETDSRLAVTPVPTTGPSPVFGPGLEGAPVTAPESLRTTGMPITGVWRRIAIAWTIDWGLARGDSNGRVLLWRRDVSDRLERLAPFATFGDPAPALRAGALWWVSWGYVSHEAFPLVRPLEWRDHDVRYLRAGLVGAVHAGTGETHLWLAPGYDSLTASWARRFEPLIEPADRLPPDLRGQLAYPSETFKLAVAHLLRASADSGGEAAAWTARPREPFQLGGPSPDGGVRLWTAIAFESGFLAPKRFVGLYAATITARGPEQHLWRASAPERLPGELVGSATLRPGQLRIWRVGDAIITLQAQLLEPATPSPTLPPPRVAEVYVTLDGRSGRGLTALAALRGGEQIVTDTTLAARWQRARRLAAQADSALGVGDLEAFSRLWRALMSELAPLQRPR